MTNTHRTKVGTALLALSAAISAQASATCQPTPVPQSDSASDDAQPERLQTNDQWRERLEAQLERARAHADRCEQALRDLDEGKSPDPSFAQEFDRPLSDGPRQFGGHRARPDGSSRDELLSDRSPENEALPSIEEIRSFVAEKLPWLAERLSRVDAERPGSSEMMLRKTQPRIIELMHKFETDPEQAAIQIEQFRLGSDIVDAIRKMRHKLESGEISESDLRITVRGFAERHFNLRIQLTQLEVDRGRASLAELEAQLAHDVETREAMIDEVTERMMSRWSRMGDRGNRPPNDRQRPRNNDRP